MAGAPAGNQNARKQNRMLTDCLKRELTQNPEEVKAIARKLIERAMEGDAWAQNLIYERCDGKVPQALIGGDEDDPEIRIGIVERAVVRSNPENSDR